MNPITSTPTAGQMTAGDNSGVSERSAQGKDAVAFAFFAFAALANLIFVVRSLDQPLIDIHAFRQTQTALSTYWIAQSAGLSGWFNYETPVFGYPWQIPYEFPLFQWIVAACYKLTGWPLDPIGRSVSALFFYGCFAPLYLLLKDLRFDKRYIFLSSALILSAPVYCYWSRGFLMESTALFFSLWYSSFLQRHLITGRNRWLILATVAGIMGVLVKVTTFFAFAAAGGLAVLVEIYRNQSWRRPVEAIKAYAGTVGSMALICIALVLWVNRSDVIKMESILGATVTSAALHDFNYGTLAQRVSVDFWSRIMLDRVLPDILGSTMVFGIVVACFFQAKRRNIKLALVFFGFFMLPIMVFVNLHSSHNYYQYSNSVFALLAAACVIWDFSSSISLLGFAAVCLVITASQWLTSYLFFYQYISYYSPFDSRLQIAEDLKTNTPSNSAIIVMGEDWKPTIAYYSRRKAIYLDAATPDQAQTMLADPEKYTGGLPVSAIIVREDRIPTKLLALYKQHSELPAWKDSVVEFGEFRVFYRIHSTVDESENEAINRNYPLNPAAEARVRMNAQCMVQLPNSWSGELNQSAVSGKFERIKINGELANSAPIIALRSGSFLEFRGWVGDATLDRADSKAHRSVLVCLHGRQSSTIRYFWGEMGGNAVVTKKETEGRGTRGEAFSNGFQSKFRIPSNIPADVYDLSIIHKSGTALIQVGQGCAFDLHKP